MRSILTKLFLLHAAALLLFGAGLAAMLAIESHARMERERYAEAKWQKSVVEGLRNERQAKLDALADGAIWDGAHRFAKNPKGDWLAEIYPNAGTTFKIDGMAVFGADGACLNKKVYRGRDHLANSRLRDWLKANKKGVLTSFFLRDGSRLVQYFVGSIHRSSDVEMKEPPAGYLAMARAWSPSLLAGLERAVGGVRFDVSEGGAKRQGAPAGYRFDLPLLGPGRETAGVLHAEARKDLLEAESVSNDVIVRLFGLYALLVVGLLVYGVYMWVVRPFKVIAQAFTTSDPEVLSALKYCRGEFGMIAASLQETLASKLRLESKASELERLVLSQSDEIERRKYRDALTGLPNRRFLRECLAGIRSIQTSYATVAVLLLDIDDMKLVNDGINEAAGDEMLVKVAATLRQAAPPHAVVARYGGDEFAVLLPSRGAEDAVEKVLLDLKSAFLQPLDCQGVPFQCTFCIGVAEVPGAAVREMAHLELLRQADTALFQAKAQGKDKVAFFDEKHSACLEKRVLTEAGLRDALRKKEFELYFQPIVSIQDGALHAVEALIRWNHPERGLVMPSDFIAIAESSDLIISMGYYQLKEGCRAILRLWEQHPEIPKFIVSINLSGKQLDCPDIVDHVAVVLEMTGFPPECLQLEVTETAMAMDMDLAIERLHRLKELGVRIAIDDFGTGYSSMATLSHLPADVLKVDMSFVQRLPHDLEAVSILRAVAAMAKSFGMETVAEGVETEEQLEFLAILGFDHIQGWLMSKAVPASALEAALSADPEHFAHKLEAAKRLSSPEAA